MSEQGLVIWTKTFYGWMAHHKGHNLSVSAYRRGDGGGFCYVARVNGSANTSPAKPHATADRAKKEAEQMARETNKNPELRRLRAAATQLRIMQRKSKTSKADHSALMVAIEHIESRIIDIDNAEADDPRR